MSEALATTLQTFIRHLAAAVSTATLYPLEHRQVGHLCEVALGELRKVLETREELALLRVDERLVVDDCPLRGGPYIGRLAQMLKYRGIGQLRLRRQIERPELLQLIAGLADRSLSAELRSTSHLRLGRTELHLAAGGCGAAGASEAGFQLPEDQVARLKEIYDGARRHHLLNAVGISEIVSNFIDALAGVGEPLLVLAPLREMDEYTFIHSVNVCVLNLAQAAAIGIEGPLLQDIGVAAMLHDVGKLFVPEAILNKPGALTEKEWQVIREHPRKGARFLLDTPGVPRMAVVTAFEHHMHFDKKGYPLVKGDWPQNLCSQMTTIADVVDSMLTRRPYREPVGLEKVSAIIRDAGGSQFHPVLSANFLRLLKKFPGQRAAD